MSRVPIEKHIWSGEGFRPLVAFGGWQVARLNWEPGMDPANLSEIERHKETDEVFVLVTGRAFLYAREDDGGLEGTELERGVTYNIPRGVWHGLLTTPDASLVIVEDRGTDERDTEIRPLTRQETVAILDALPGWLRGERAKAEGRR